MHLQILVILTFMVTKGALKFKPTKWHNPGIPMVWVDGRYRKPGAKHIDTFFDRIVSIVYASLFSTFSFESFEENLNSTDPDLNKMFQNEVTAVFISDTLLLTSYNGLNKLSQKNDTKDNLTIFILKNRVFDTNGHFIHYGLYADAKLVCARQVIPDSLDAAPSHMRHGEHSTIHDLMVIRIDKSLEFVDPIPKTRFHFDNILEDEELQLDDELGKYEHSVGPILTELAGAGDHVTDNLKFASLGHVNDAHIMQSRFLEASKPYSEADVADCDEWIPREWGYFICLHNVHEYAGIASGAMLFSEEKLFGVGSFALFKGNRSVLVYTDVRPYEELLLKTCTVSDQKLEEAKRETSNRRR